MSTTHDAATADGFIELVRRAAGHDPYPYQVRIATDGLPELLAVPTGAGKTLAVVLPWLYRRRFHPDPAVRAATPRRLVLVLPMRVLVEQTRGVATGWLDALGLTEVVACHLLLGGEAQTDDWRRSATTGDQIIIGTLDMILSRALNRGYGASRFTWPIDFGLLSSGCHFVYDEVQLMGPALPTSRQLHGLRDKLGTIEPCTSTWMSATVPDTGLATVDAPPIATRIDLTDRDRIGPLAARLDARKHVARIGGSAAGHDASIADYLVSNHRAGTLSLAVLNTVERARAVHSRIGKALSSVSDSPEVVLLHSRFRPPDRLHRVERVLAPCDPDGPGRIVVSTQVVEAGVDISARLLVTEAAAWPSVVQRAGRCNRDGRIDDAVLAWTAPPDHHPYEQADVDAAIAELETLTGGELTPQGTQALTVPVTEVVHPVLRRKDLLDLFDTAPDLSGNDIDVARFIREADDVDAAVAWRSVVDGTPVDQDVADRDERCPVPVGELRKLVKSGRAMWRFDHLEGRYERVRSADEIRPGAILVLNRSDGGYTSSTGWAPESRVPVDEVAAAAALTWGDADARVADDPASALGKWVSLVRHLDDTEQATRRILSTLSPGACRPDLADAAARAAGLHDIGKAHSQFQNAVRSIASSDGTPAPPDDVLLAKSGSRGRLHFQRGVFRHELAAALALLGEGAAALEDAAERELIVYLVAAHHGRVRLMARAIPQESRSHDVVLGVAQGDELPPIPLTSRELPACILDLSALRAGDRDGRPSWTAQALTLRDRSDLGPFRLGFLEAVVRLADWEASALEAADA